jgi:hypothetical protein
MSLWNYVRLPVCVPSSGGKRRDLILGVFTTVLGMFFDGSGCFWPWRQQGREDLWRHGSAPWSKNILAVQGENYADQDWA